MPRKPVVSLLVSVAFAVSAAGCGDGVESGDGVEPGGWVSLTDEPSGAEFALPTDAEANENTALADDGSEVSLRNYSSTALDGVVEVGFNVIDTEGNGYDLDAGVAGVADTLDGEVVSTVDTAVDGSPAIDVEMTYGDDKVVLFQLVSTDEHVMQTLVSGPESEREAVEITYQKLNESLEVD